VLTIASAVLAPDPQSVGSAREVVGKVTATLPRRAREAAELITSELATNAVQHAGTPFQVFAAADDSGVEVVVSDQAGWTAGSTPHGHGHGLLLVGLLSTAWATELEGHGKRVWARLNVDDVPIN